MFLNETEQWKIIYLWNNCEWNGAKTIPLEIHL